MISSSDNQQYDDDYEEEDISFQSNYLYKRNEESKEQIMIQKQTTINAFTENQKRTFYNQCQNIVNQLMKSENAFFFFRPVDPEKDKAPGYYEFIAQPMSIYIVQQKIDNGQYQTPNEFISDMRLIWSNAKLYNAAPSHPVFKAADALSSKFELMAATLPHLVDDESINSGFQREVELRFARYRLMKKTHL